MTQPETKAQVRDRIALEIYLRIHPHMNTPDNKVYHTPERSKTLQALHELWNERDKLAQQEVDALVKALEEIASAHGYAKGEEPYECIHAFEALAKHRG